MRLSAWVIYQSRNLKRAVLVRRQSYFFIDGDVIATYRTREAADAALARYARAESRKSRQAAPGDRTARLTRQKSQSEKGAKA